MDQMKLQDQPQAIALEVVHKGRRPGRKRKLTPALFEKIMRSVQNGDRINVTCIRHGISDSTLFALIAKDPECAKRFAEAKQLRLQKWHEEWLGEMIDHSKHSPWATGFLLERNFPHLYAMREVTRPAVATDQAHLQTNVITIDDAEFEKLSGKSEYKLLANGDLERVMGSKRTIIVRQSQANRLLMPDNGSQAAG